MQQVCRLASQISGAAKRSEATRQQRKYTTCNYCTRTSFGLSTPREPLSISHLNYCVIRIWVRLAILYFVHSLIKLNVHLNVTLAFDVDTQHYNTCAHSRFKHVTFKPRRCLARGQIGVEVNNIWYASWISEVLAMAICYLA